MDIISIVILCLIALGVIIGLIKGFPLKKLYSALFYICLGAAYILGVPLARNLMNTEMGYVHLQNAYVSLLPQSETFTQTMNPDADLRVAQYKAALTELKIPNFFQGLFTSHVIDNGTDVSSAIASSFAYLTLIASCIIVLFLFLFILGKLILKFCGKMVFGENGKGFFGRIFGLLLGGAKAIFIVLLCMIVVSLVDQLTLKYGYTTIHDFLTAELYLEDPSMLTVGKLFYQTASSLWSWITNK